MPGPRRYRRVNRHQALFIQDERGIVDIHRGQTEHRPAPTGIWPLADSVGTHQTCVGAGLPAMAVCQAPSMLNVPAPSRAGSLPQGAWPLADSVGTHQTCVGAGLPTMAVCQAPSMLNVPAPSQAGSLPQGAWPLADSVGSTNLCGSGPGGAPLARDGSVSGTLDVECAGPIASKPAPTEILAARRFCRYHQPVWERAGRRSACPRWQCVRHHRC